MYKIFLILILLLNVNANAEWEEIENNLDSTNEYEEINFNSETWYVLDKEESQVFTSDDLKIWNLAYISNFQLSNSIGENYNLIREGEQSTFSTSLYIIEDANSIEKLIRLNGKIITSVFTFEGNDFLSYVEIPGITSIKQIDSEFNVMNTFSSIDQLSNHAFVFENTIYLNTQTAIYILNESSEWEIEYSEKNTSDLDRTAISNNSVIFYGDTNYIYKTINSNWESLTFSENLIINNIKVVNKSNNKFIAVGSDGNSGIVISIDFVNDSPEIDIIHTAEGYDFTDFYFENNEIVVVDRSGKLLFNDALLTNIRDEISKDKMYNSIKVFSIRGELITSETQTKLNDVPLSPGMYLVQYQENGISKTDKIFIME